MAYKGKNQTFVNWLREHKLPVGSCEIRRKCPLYTSRFIDNNTKSFACESAKGNLYNTDSDDVVIGVFVCPYLSLARVKNNP